MHDSINAAQLALQRLGQRLVVVAARPAEIDGIDGGLRAPACGNRIVHLFQFGHSTPGEYHRSAQLRTASRQLTAKSATGTGNEYATTRQ